MNERWNREANVELSNILEQKVPSEMALAALAGCDEGSVGAGIGVESKSFSQGIERRLCEVAEEIGVLVSDVAIAGWIATTWRLNAHRDTKFNMLLDHNEQEEALESADGGRSRYCPFWIPVDADIAGKELIRRTSQKRSQALAFHPQSDSRLGCDWSAAQGEARFSCRLVESISGLDRLAFHEGKGQPPLDVWVSIANDGIRVDILYRKRVFPERAMQCLIDTFLNIVTGMCNNLDAQLARLKLVDEHQKGWILQNFGLAAERDRPVRETAYELFKEQARETPDRLAIVHASQRCSYRELSIRAASVSRWLCDNGISPGAIVALFMDRSIDTVAAILGVWRAGIAYVPIDIDGPAERTEFILRDSNAQAILTDINLMKRLPKSQLKCCDLSRLSFCEETEAQSERETTKNELAYVIYTSGTSGRPKGVMIEHQSIANLAGAHRSRIYRHHDPDWQGLRASLNAPFVFDASIERITLLFSGFTLYLTDEQTRRDPIAFMNFVDENQLALLDVTPAFLSLLIEQGFPSSLKRVPSLVVVGGESISPMLWQRLARSPIAFYNVYGPTEATVNATAVRIEGEYPNIGWPLANCRVYILGPALEIIPPGAVGELHIAGLGLGRGYLNGYELTQEKFVPNPYACGNEQYDRLYKTGDLGFFRQDGRIEFVGRADNQVKIRGYRVELSEVEAALVNVRDIAQAVVVAQKQESGEAILVAYVTGHTGVESEVDVIFDEISKILPEYMVPSAIIVLEKLPLTTNGKVDVKALPRTEERRTSAALNVQANTPTEDVLMEIWTSFLGARELSVLDNFFKLGGSSLTAVKVILAIRKRYGFEMPVGAMFETPTVRELAARIDAEALKGVRLMGDG